MNLAKITELFQILGMVCYNTSLIYICSLKVCNQFYEANVAVLTEIKRGYFDGKVVNSFNKYKRMLLSLLILESLSCENIYEHIQQL